MAESFENGDNVLPDWANEDVGKTRAEAVNRSEKQGEERKSRFFVESDLEKILEQSQSSGTKRNTKWVVKLFQDWCQERNITTPLLEMNTTELDRNLARFYVEARTIKGEEYSRSALLGFRNSIERYLNNNGVTLKISKTQAFQNSNKILDAKLRINRRAGKDNVQHKPVIVASDLAKIRASPFLSMTTPAGLLRRTWFYVSLNWCRCGREGLRDLHRNSFKFMRDANGQEYAVITREEAIKTNPGGETSKPSIERETRLYSTGAIDDPFASLKLYVSKLNPLCTAFFQHPKQDVTNEDTVWYKNRPLGINKLGEMMKNISVGAKLSQIYTNHSIRASATTLLSSANVPDCHILFVSGHSSEQNKAQISSRPSVLQLESVSDTISNALENDQPKSTHISLVTNAPLIESSNQTASNMSMSSATTSFPSGFVNSCNVQGNVQIHSNTAGITMTDKVNSSLVLVLYTGGTIGMKKLNDNEPCALHLDLFIDELKKLQVLHDPTCCVSHVGKVDATRRLAMPVVKLGSRILYDIKKAGTIKESKDTCVEDWIDVGTEIANHYEDYDGFLILHGTDTMAFTASALSFMFENLGKPVVLTGAQTSIYEAVTDARDNLAGALLFAGQYAIPEVTIFFDGKLFRGNRSTKVDAKSYSVFDSPSFPPLARLCSNGDIEWNHTVDRSRSETGSFTLHTKMSQKISLLPMFPGIPVEMIKGCLEPPIEGVVLVTYGSGNIPDSRTDLVEAIKGAIERGVVTVTCCPCRGGPHDVSTEYVEQGLVKLGVVPGKDMTVESALAKLSFVMGKEALAREDRKMLMRSNLRGEISTSK